MILRKLTDVAQKYVGEVLKEGDHAIDATVGNGKDTEFLARRVGENGKVYGFDIQDVAIEKTFKSLQEKNLALRVKFIKDGHENMLKYIEKPVKAIMFNLGYLPGGNHKIITRPDTTVKAIDDGLKILLPGGLVSIICYYGHPGGIEEKDSVLNYVKALDAFKYTVLYYGYINKKNNPPILILIEKIKNTCKSY